MWFKAKAYILYAWEADLILYEKIAKVYYMMVRVTFTKISILTMEIFDIEVKLAVNVSNVFICPLMFCKSNTII